MVYSYFIIKFLSMIICPLMKTGDDSPVCSLEQAGKSSPVSAQPSCKYENHRLAKIKY
jgi:hypothetical protein